MSECIRVATATNLNEMKHLNTVNELVDVVKADLSLADSKTTESESDQKETVIKSVSLDEEHMPQTNPKVNVIN